MKKLIINTVFLLPNSCNCQIFFQNSKLSTSPKFYLAKAFHYMVFLTQELSEALKYCIARKFDGKKI